jgi:hypothetical protein
MNRSTFAVLLALLLACGRAQASEWVSIGKSDAVNAEFFIDVSSIRVSGNTRRAWSKSVVTPHTARGAGSDADKWVRHDVTHWVFNCSEETGRFDAFTTHYTDGTSHTEESTRNPIAPIAPDTMTSEVMHFVCAWKPK